jgi:hypothetical protein
LKIIQIFALLHPLRENIRSISAKVAMIWMRSAKGSRCTFSASSARGAQYMCDGAHQSFPAHGTPPASEDGKNTNAADAYG